MDNLSDLENLLSNGGGSGGGSSKKTIIALVVIGVVVLLIIGIGVGIGVYFYRKNKKTKPPYQVFGIQLPKTAFITNATNNDDLVAKVTPLINAIKSNYSVTSLASFDQLTTAVEKYGLTTCFYGMVDSDFENVYIAPYLTSEEQVKGNECAATKDNVKVHKVNKLPITFTESSISHPIQGFFVYSPDGTDPPANGATVTIGDFECTIITIYVS
jgi:hypothetical protein